MNIKNFLNIVSEEIKCKSVRKNIVKEMELHIEESKESFILEGMTDRAAEEKAVLQMGDPKVIGKKLNKIHRHKIDWKLVLIILVLICLGFLNASNKGFGIEINGNISMTQTLEAYIIAIIIGVFFSILLYRINYKKFNKYSLILYIIATMLTIMHCNLGNEFDGTIFNNFNATIISAPIYIIAFAGLIENKKNSTIKNKTNLKIVLLSIISIIILGIRKLEHAFLVGIVYLIISSIKLAEQKEKKYRYKTTVLLILISICILFVSLKPNIEMINKEKDIINSAKLIGNVDSIDIVESYFVKNANYAFISLLANNGWIISCGMILLIILLNLKLIINAIKIKDSYGKFLIIGIASMFIVETVLNLVINIAFGIPSDFNIPLVSYGKINLIIDMMCLSVTLSVYRKKNIILYTNEIEKEKSKLAVIKF